MKVSKRSLIVSIAVLCVCALSLTAASFAWFSASQTAMVKEINLEVKAQSDIKLSAVKDATANSASTDWKTTLVQTDFIGENAIEESIADATSADTAFAGNFKTLTAEARKKIDSNSGEVISGEAALSDSDYMTLSSAASGYYSEFTVYVRATEEKDIVINFNDFKYVVETNGAWTPASDGAASAVDALRLGYVGSDNAVNNILDGSEKSAQVVINSSDLTAFSDGNGYYGEVTFYVWVEGTDGACATKNALSLKNYQFNIDFAYAA